MQKLRIVRDFGWEIAHGAVTRRPLIPLYTMVPLIPGATRATRAFGICPSLTFGRPVPNPSVTIRIFFIAVLTRVSSCVQKPRPGAAGGAREAAAASEGGLSQDASGVRHAVLVISVSSVSMGTNLAHALALLSYKPIAELIVCELSFGERYTASRLRSRVRFP